MINSNKKKRVILVVFNNFKNDSRVLKEALSLKANGYIVNVVALHEEPLAERESFNGVFVHRLKLLTKRWSKNKFIQLFKYAEFLFRFFKEYRDLDIIHCNDLVTLPIGIFAKVFINRNQKIKILYDAHEYEIDDVPYQPSILIKLKYYIEKFSVKFADKVITVSESIANEYSRLYAIPKPALVLNCPPCTRVSRHDLFRKEFGIRNDQIIFLYQGGLCRGRGIETLLKIFGSSRDDKDVIVFMGSGSLEKEIRNQAEIYDTIYFKQTVPPMVLLNYTASADYGITFVEDSCLNHRYCLPNKLFEYLMAGIPVLVSNLFEMKQFILQHNVGLVVEENTCASFIEAMKKIKKMNHRQLQNNIAQVRKVFTWEEQEKKLLQVYKELSRA